MGNIPLFAKTTRETSSHLTNVQLFCDLLHVQLQLPGPTCILPFFEGTRKLLSHHSAWQSGGLMHTKYCSEQGSNLRSLLCKTPLVQCQRPTPSPFTTPPSLGLFTTTLLNLLLSSCMLVCAVLCDRWECGWRSIERTGNSSGVDQWSWAQLEQGNAIMPCFVLWWI